MPRVSAGRPTPALAGPLLLGDDRDDHLGDHLGVQVDAHRVVAQGLDAALEIDPPLSTSTPLAASASAISVAVTEP